MPYEYQFLLIIPLAMISGLLIEIIQSYSGRDFSLSDIYVDILGASISIIWFSKTKIIIKKFSPIILKLSSIFAIFICLLPLVLNTMDELVARIQFPVLADFRSPLELNRFGGNAQLKQENEYLLVRFGTEKYSGFGLKYFPRCWTGYQSVQLDVNNPNRENVVLTCRIHDVLHNNSYDDRFNEKYNINPGDQEIIIDLGRVETAPRSRTMDMCRIGALGCFTTYQKLPVELIFRQIVLNKRHE